MKESPLPWATVELEGDNLFKWICTVIGPDGSPYEKGSPRSLFLAPLSQVSSSLSCASPTSTPSRRLRCFSRLRSTIPTCSRRTARSALPSYATSGARSSRSTRARPLIPRLITPSFSFPCLILLQSSSSFVKCWLSRTLTPLWRRRWPSSTVTTGPAISRPPRSGPRNTPLSRPSILPINTH